jgi:23S rRNA (uracil1939-C5)-methyltransferase
MQGVYQVRVERIVAGGYGIAFAAGLTIFVLLASPGDVAKVRVTRKKGKVAFAEIEEIVTPSPKRVEPACRYFGECGGCDFQQLSNEEQLEAKTEIVKDCLRRIGKIDWLDKIKIIPSSEPLGYRSRARWHVESSKKAIGYYSRGTNTVCDVEECPILTPALDAELRRLRSEIKWEDVWEKVEEVEAAEADGAFSLAWENSIDEPKEIVCNVGDLRYAYDAGTFFQGNRFLAEALVESAVAGFAGKKAVDLYCGVGLFSLPLAWNFESVVGIEANEKSVAFARKNAKCAGLQNAEFAAASVAEWLKENPDELRDLDLVVLDPPRSGTESGVIESLMAAAPRQISYVACDPAMLARDLKMLCHRYEISSIVALDLFPQTHHIETVVRLEKTD